MASVDVAVPCYQYGHYLRDCLTSILNQGIRDLRVVVIDNASTDDTLKVAREFAAADRRVGIIAHPVNLGQHASFNEAIDWAEADYFMLLCADDALAPGSLSRALAVLEKHPEVHLTYGQELEMSDGPIPPVQQPTQCASYRVVPGRELLECLCRAGRSFFGAQSVVVRTSVQKQVGHYRSELVHTDDFEMWMRFACIGSVAEIHAVQGLKRAHPLNRCATVHNVHMWDLHYEAAFESFFAKEGASVDGARRLRRIARRALSERAYWGSVASLLRGDARLSFDLLRFALTRNPISVVVPPLGYLFRRRDAFQKIAQVFSEAVAGIAAPVKEGRLGQ